MATVAARSIAAGVISTKLSSCLRARSRNAISFLRRPPPATVVLSVSSSAPPAANPKYHNAKADVGKEEVNGEELLRRFTREAVRTGVVEEIRRRLRHEDAWDRRKRKARGWC
jgi:ribosomal protein S21